MPGSFISVVLSLSSKVGYCMCAPQVRTCIRPYRPYKYPYQRLPSLFFFSQTDALHHTTSAGFPFSCFTSKSALHPPWPESKRQGKKKTMERGRTFTTCGASKAPTYVLVSSIRL
ncbi:hypothetical protein BGZ63DRAFT_240202 [Mariannaea sp. PMI_226]|nr:hypothetical protein BGZ63DRAFT_240202 [Mariannaea sp. PMI_226]